MESPLASDTPPAGARNQTAAEAAGRGDRLPLAAAAALILLLCFLGGGFGPVGARPLPLPEAIGGELDESFQFALDWDLLLRFRAAGARIVRLPRFLGAFRVHDDQKTSAKIGRRVPEAAARQHVMGIWCRSGLL